MVKDEDVWVVSQQQAKDENGKVATFELKAVKVATLEGLLIQEHGDLFELLLLDVLSKGEEASGIEGEVVEDWPVFVPYFFKDQVLECDDEGGESSPRNHRCKDVPNQILNVFAHQDMKYQAFVFEHFHQGWTNDFPLHNIHCPLVLFLLHLHPIQLPLYDLKESQSLNPLQYIKAISKILLKQQKLLMIAKDHSFDNIMEGAFPMYGLNHLISLRLDESSGYDRFILTISQPHYYIVMQAVGSQVIIALSIPLIAITTLIAYKWQVIKGYFGRQEPNAAPQEQNELQRARRERQDNDQVCSICLEQPKILPVSSTCGHSFCGECIFQFYDRLHERIKCPLCRQEIYTLFKLFQHSAESQQLELKIRNYNARFGDGRPLLRIIVQLPYVLQRVRRFAMSGQFFIFFIRAYLLRVLIYALIYVIIPIDFIPEKLLGLLGFIDDIMWIIFIILVFVSIGGLEFMRRRE